jgi:IS5 family transposase
MRTLIDFAISCEYEKVKKRGDKLSALEALVNWNAFLPIAEGLYNNKSERGGRPNINIILMIKLLILQQMYGLSDPELERQVADRISFRVFLGTTEVIPDYSTVWLFRERLIKSGKLEAIWEEFLSQLKAKGYEIKKGVIQDATFSCKTIRNEIDNKGCYPPAPGVLFLTSYPAFATYRIISSRDII